MVFFTCGACNESLKKNQVEKHLYKCRRCEFLSCIDCSKEFWGETYKSHIKCITEEQKYSGKNYVSKPNKGEVKQEKWIEKVQAAIQKAQTNPQLKSLLQRLQEYPNIPRKKTKFENFLKCSLRVLNKGLTNQVWDLLMAEAKQQNDSSTATNAGSESKPPPSQPGETDAEAATPAESADPEAEETEKKLSKRERKEQRQKKVHKSEKKDRQAAAEEEEEEEDAGKKKKGKRRKRGEEEEEEEEEVASEPKKKKRRKGENGVAMDTQETAEENGDGGDDSQDDALPPSEKMGKFNWGQIITAVLEAKGEISVKKLQKKVKVLAEYASYGSSRPDDRLQAKFHKKLSHLPNVKVLKDRARLLAS